MLNRKVLLNLFLLLTAVGFWSCSTKKNAFLNRNLHSLATKYNILYNGNVAFDQAKKTLDDSYNDNFWELLPIEPLKIEEEKLTVPNSPIKKKKESSEGESTAQGFDRAEEKAIKAIQKHSMDIAGKERNRQIDDAYLLLGKSRYYSQRFVPALEAFNFILETYTDADLKDETRVWQAKTLVRLQNEKLALETLQILLKNQQLPLKVIENAHTAMAMAYQSIDSTNLVIRHLDSAVLFSVNNKLKARNQFILGQLYRREQKIDSSNMVFEALANNKKAPLRYKVHALIDRAKNYSKKDSTELLFATLNKLIKDRDNRPFLDELYYQKARIELQNDSVSKAIVNFEKSLRTTQVKDFQKELSYEQLGNIYFDKAAFEPAGAYYDSVIQITKNKNVKRIRRIVRKRKSLEEVIRYEHIAKNNDSILKIASLPKEEQEQYYQLYIDKLKQEEEAAKKKLEETAITSGFGNFNESSSNETTRRKGKKGKFYFYNVQVAGFGKQEFRKIWGNRALEDNWRLSTKKAALKDVDQVKDLDIANSFDTSKKYELDYYLSRIPTEKKKIDSITTQRNSAYYKLGLIYKEQFKEYPLAADRLEKLLSFKPKENLILPIKYHLYKIYSNFNRTKSNKYKENIVNTYPDSRYASIILNPEHVLLSNEKDNSPEAIYNDAYCDYDYERYEEALQKSNHAIKQFEDMPIIPKFELLKAYILMETKGTVAFKEALNFVAINYPNTEEGKHAVKMLGGLNTVSTDKKSKLKRDK